jgi:hypothetical protein
MIALPAEADTVGAVAVGWATVELDRAARELSHLLAAGAAFAPADASLILGASCRSAPAAQSGLSIALLEPDTEGRLAGTLARNGEGWVATWVLPGATGGRTLSAARPGPFGPERLVLGEPSTVPDRLVVEAVPSPP